MSRVRLWNSLKSYPIGLQCRDYADYAHRTNVETQWVTEHKHPNCMRFIHERGIFDTYSLFIVPFLLQPGTICIMFFPRSIIWSVKQGQDLSEYYSLNISKLLKATCNAQLKRGFLQGRSISQPTHNQKLPHPHPRLFTTYTTLYYWGHNMKTIWNRMTW